jgi:endonuclease I
MKINYPIQKNELNKQKKRIYPGSKNELHKNKEVIQVKRKKNTFPYISKSELVKMTKLLLV